MKNIVALLLITLSSITLLQAQSVLVPIMIPNDISSAVDATEPATTAIVANDVYYNGNVIIRQGTIINTTGTITPKKALGKPGKISLQFISTTDVNGNNVLLSGCNLNKEGKSKKEESICLAVGLGALVALPFLFFLCMKGHDVIIPAGTTLNCNGFLN